MIYRKPLIGVSIFLVLSLVVTWLVFNTLRREIGGPTRTYSAAFTDVSGLHAGDDVRVAGVRVGRVDKVDLDGTHARVTFRIQKDQVLYTNTVAAVTYQNIIGERYLGLSAGPPGDQRPLADGGQIPLQHTVPSFDIGYLLNGFEPLFTALDPQKFDNLTNAIIQALQGDTGSVLTLLTQTSELAELVAGPDQLLGDVIDNLNGAVANLARQSATLQTLISQSQYVLGNLDSRRDTLIASAGSINATLARVATIVANILPDLQGLIRRQPGFAAHIVDNPDRFAYLGANLAPALKGIARTSQEGTYVDGYACNVNVTLFAFLGRLIPAFVRLSSPGNIIRESPVCR